MKKWENQNVKNSLVKFGKRNNSERPLVQTKPTYVAGSGTLNGTLLHRIAFWGVFRCPELVHNVLQKVPLCALFLLYFLYFD